MRTGCAFILATLSTMLPTVVLADVKAGEKKAQLCLLCHKPGFAAAYAPLLEAQPARYLYSQVRAFREKRRGPPEMQANVASLSDKDVRDIAAYFAARKPPRITFSLDPARVALGRQRAVELRCADCHLPDYAGKDDVPRLAGQVPGYTTEQLNRFQSGKRMHDKGAVPGALRDLTEQDAENLGQYFASIE